jgi:hypothetical protein
MGRIFKNLPSAIWLWREKSDTHNPISTGNVLLRIATIVDQSAIAKPSSAYGRQGVNTRIHQTRVDVQLTGAKTVRFQLESSDGVSWRIIECRPGIIPIAGFQRVVFCFVEDYNISIIYDRHLHRWDTACAPQLVFTRAAPCSCRDWLKSAINVAPVHWQCASGIVGYVGWFETLDQPLVAYITSDNSVGTCDDRKESENAN